MSADWIIDDETLLAFLDGELDPARASVVAAAIASDPALARKAEQHRRLKEKLRHAFDSLLHMPTPAGRIPASAQVIDFPPRRPRRLPSFEWQRYAALAAMLVAGLLGGYALRPAAEGPVRAENGQLVASAGLARVLDSQLSGHAVNGVRIQSSFRAEDGSVCRGFTGATASGIACREGDRWRIAGLFPASAGAEDPRVAALADTLISGKPFDAAQEKAAWEKGWR